MILQVLVTNSPSHIWRALHTRLAYQPPGLIAAPLLGASLGLALVNYSNNGQQEKFFRSVQRGNVGEVMKLLNNRTVDVKGRHELGWTALHLAAVNGRQEIVGILLSAGADPDAEDEFMNVYTTA